MATLSTANSKLIITASAGVLAVPAPIQGYATDDLFTSESVNIAEVRMGADGILSAGYTPYPVPLEITLQADSPSVLVFDTLRQAQDALKDLVQMGAEIQYPSVGKTFLFTNGWLTSTKVLPDAKKLLEPMRYRFMFQSCVAVPLSV